MSRHPVIEKFHRNRMPNDNWQVLPLFGKIPDRIIFWWNAKEKILKYRKVFDLENQHEELILDIEGDDIFLLKKQIEESFGELGWADDKERIRPYTKKVKTA